MTPDDVMHETLAQVKEVKPKRRKGEMIRTKMLQDKKRGRESKRRLEDKPSGRKSTEFSRVSINLRANQDSKLQMAALKRYRMRCIKVRDIVSVTDIASREKNKGKKGRK